MAAVLRERIYGGIACLSTLLVLVRHLDGDTTAWTASVDVAVAIGSLWAASLLAGHKEGRRVAGGWKVTPDGTGGTCT